MSIPPPLPSNTPPSPVVRAPETRRGRRWPWWAWTGLFLLFAGIAGVVGTGLFLAGSFVGEGMELFEEDARAALQRNPTIRARIGTIREMETNWTGTGNAPHPDDFVFDLTGDLGAGRVQARFETVAGGERIDQGVLRTRDGNEWPLAPDPGPDAETEAWPQEPTSDASAETSAESER